MPEKTCHTSDLELQLHAGDGLPGLWLRQFLDVSSQVAGRNLCVAALDGLQQGVVDEDVLVFRLHHVVALRTQAGHVTINVHSLLVLDAFQHGVDDDEGSSAAHAGTARERKRVRRWHGRGALGVKWGKMAGWEGRGVGLR